MNRHIFLGIMTGLLVPYVGTLAWTGSVHGEELRYEQQRQLSGKYRIRLDRWDGAAGQGRSREEGAYGSYYMDLEEYLPGVIAGQIPADFEPEALKAQAVIARTYIIGQIMAQNAGKNSRQTDEQSGAVQIREEASREIAESALDMDYRTAAQLKELWGSSLFPSYYKKLEAAVNETEGLVVTDGSALIDPLFCRASAGRTRAGDDLHPYLKMVECPEDGKAPGFLQLLVFTEEQAAAAVNSIPAADEGERRVREQGLAETLQIISRDEAGYVEEIQADGYCFTGEEFQYALGLQSANFTLEPYGGGIRAAVRGIGHGYGLSQTTANKKAEEGWTAEEILAFFYSGCSCREEDSLSGL